jgi:polysaccharide pyruvyl transferase WcaK-like protein
LYDISLFGPYGAGNIGDDAILQALLERHFDAEKQCLAIITEDSLTTARHIHTAFLVNRCETNMMINTIRRSRGLLIAGGTMISDSQGMDFPFGYSNATLDTVRRYNKPHAMMGVGMNTVTTREGVDFFRKWYDRVIVFTVRDDYCGNVLLDQGISQDRIVIAADPVFGWSFQRKITEEMEALLQNISQHPYKIAVNVTNEEWQSQKQLYSEIARCCDWLMKRLDVQIVFFASDCRAEEQFDSAAIDFTMKQMSERAFVLSALNYKPVELASFLGHFDIVLSMRMHPLIFGALCDAVPVGIIRQQKMVRVLEEIGCEPNVYANSVTAAQLFELCNARLKDLPSLRMSMRRQLKLLSERELNNRRAVEAMLD